LKEAKDVVDYPSNVKKVLLEKEAEGLKKIFRRAGAEVEQIVLLFEN
jgi:ribosomal protein L7/L12